MGIEAINMQNLPWIFEALRLHKSQLTEVFVLAAFSHSESSQLFFLLLKHVLLLAPFTPSYFFCWVKTKRWRFSIYGSLFVILAGRTCWVAQILICETSSAPLSRNYHQINNRNQISTRAAQWRSGVNKKLNLINRSGSDLLVLTATAGFMTNESGIWTKSSLKGKSLNSFQVVALAERSLVLGHNYSHYCTKLWQITLILSAFCWVWLQVCFRLSQRSCLCLFKFI